MLVKVFLANCSSRVVEVSEDSTVRDVCRVMARKLGLVDVDEAVRFSGLFQSFDGVTHDVLVREDANVGEVAKGCVRMLFKIAALTEACLTSTDPGVMFLRFIQAVHDINVGDLVSSFRCKKWGGVFQTQTLLTLSEDFLSFTCLLFSFFLFLDHTSFRQS